MPERFTLRTKPKVMFANCGHFAHRPLSESFRLNYISAGRGRTDGVRPYFFSNQIRNLIIGDILCVYRNKVGYVGIAKVISRPMRITQATLSGNPVSRQTFAYNVDIFEESEDPGYEECLVEIEWLTNVHLGEKQGSGSCYGIYAKPHAVCSLDNQQFLKQQLQIAFGLSFDTLLAYAPVPVSGAELK